MPFDIEKCARPNILALEPYRCARECVFPILAIIIIIGIDNESTAPDNRIVTTKTTAQMFS